MKRKRVILSIDDILGIIKDYVTEEDLPADAMPVQLLLKPNEMGAMAIVAESDQWQPGMAPINVTFRLKRVYGV